MTELERLMDQIPDDGEWWVSDSGDEFIWAAERMLSKGFTLDETIELLTKLYHAVAAEFGS